jgi:LysR family glycine cleavage system transcriptional activator
MAQPLPPLKAMRYFEVSARHLSFTKAADELNVTHSAISHQIKALEDWLGVPLFRRQNRSLQLTEAGHAYLPALKDAFERLAEASRRVRAREQGGPLVVSTMPSFAAKWLVPRLRGFRAAHPEIDVRISADDRVVDFDREDVDLAIRYGRGSWAGLRVDRLASEMMVPVCSPRLRDGPPPMRKPADLLNYDLLQDHDWRDDYWLRWLTAAGLPEVRPRRALSFNYTDLMIRAAIDGLGVALCPAALVSDDVAAGRLVRPFEVHLRTESGYYLVTPLARATRPKIVAFRSWMLAEIAATGEEAVAATVDGLIGG